MFGAFDGVLKLWDTLGAAWSIFGRMDQRGRPWKNVGIFGNLFGISPYHFECFNIHSIFI